MNRLLILPVLLLTLLVGNSAFSADEQKGLDAALSGDYATALREWTPLAEQGNARAQYNLGKLIFGGEDQSRAPSGFSFVQSEQTYRTAIYWFERAASQGHTNAQYYLGVMYEEGRGVSKNYRIAAKWYRLAAAAGNAYASIAPVRFQETGS